MSFNSTNVKNANFEIRFWGPKNQYGFLSNFAYAPMVIDNVTYLTNEHYFQSKKFTGTKHENNIISLSSPAEVAHMGKRRDLPLRKDWEEIKEKVMLEGLVQKFEQHEDFKKRLLNTVGLTLIEDSPYDYYWGVGKNHTGKNRLGVLLMYCRDQLFS